MDYYQILGIEKSASQEDIKRAYRKLAHKYHPDKGGNEQKFKEINEAYQILGNQEKRSQYDRFGKTFEGMGTEGFGKGFDFGSLWEDIRGEDSDFGENIGDLFEDFFGFGTKTRRTKVNQGRDIEVEIKIDLEDILKGAKRNISLVKMVKCLRCQGLGAEPGTEIKECFSCRGTGEVQQMKKTIFGTISRYIICPECGGQGKVPKKPCNVCQGEGRIQNREEIEIILPKGVDSGQIIKIQGKGEAGKRGAGSGDLYVRIFVKKHSLFERKGDDLYILISISFSQAALGDEIEVPTLDGSTSSPQVGSTGSSQEKKILLRVPQGTESGNIFRVSGKGIPHFSGWGKGDLYIELIVKTPKKLTKKQKELLKKLKEEGL